MCKQSKENLLVLEELTENLPPVCLSELVNNRNDIRPKFTNYQAVNGTSLGFSLLSEERIAIQRNFCSVGTIFPRHSHVKSTEYLIVYEGSLKVRVNNDDIIILKTGDSIKFNPGDFHSTQALEDTWMIGIIIPREEGYPE